ncbi:MAG: asparagine synthase (glutamine-hydrolyzing) [Acidobacteriaceae bacterium]|nr:asparagine synthase (glutamine-hydrolyzing) [Acidobacteriaceae bacterium]
MCGIAGQFRIEQRVAQSDIRGMCDQIRHRGPDDEGYYIDGSCGIGMRRLSIIDLSTGHQPISNEDGSIWVVFNGEIYSYQALRQDLIRRGHRFKTNSDTETLIHLYEEEGVNGIAKLRGMFAYAIWDSNRKTLLLARDRFGKKPLYYATLPSGLYFGSELKCLRAAGVPLEIDHEALRLYIQFNYIPDPWSPYRAVKKLAPGSWMRYHADGRVEHGQYWKLPAPAEHAPADLDRETARNQIRQVFDEAVRLRMIADVPLGAFLSGGVDSSAIVASMALQSDEPVKTFSIGFEGATANELPFAKMIAEQYRTEHHELTISPASIDLIPKIVHACDEPFGDAAAIPIYIMSEFARQYVKVVLTGDGGDEIFGGYESFFQVDRMRWANRIPSLGRALFRTLARMLPYSAYGKNYLYALGQPTDLARYLEMNSAHYFLRRQVLEPEWMLPSDDAYLTNALSHCLLPDDASVLSQALYFEATAKLTGDMLVKIDRASMAQSIEVRCPFLDHELAELAARVPHAWKLSDGSGKKILLEAIGDRLPQEIVNRKKMGFSFPLAVWFRGPLKSFLWDHLTSQTFIDRHIAKPAFVRHLLVEHDSQRRDNSHWLYMLLFLELWFRENASLEASPAAQEVGSCQ